MAEALRLAAMLAGRVARCIQADVGARLQSKRELIHSSTLSAALRNIEETATQILLVSILTSAIFALGPSRAMTWNLGELIQPEQG